MKVVVIVLLELQTFATEEDVIPKGTPSKHLRMHLDLFQWKDSHSDRPHIERLDMSRA